MRKLYLLGSLALIFAACSSENVEDLSDDCKTREITYQSEMESLISSNCATAGCHVGPNGIGGLDLSTFNDVKQIAATGQLLGRVTGSNGNIMPPSGQLGQCEIKKITAWVQDGAPEN